VQVLTTGQLPGEYALVHDCASAGWPETAGCCERYGRWVVDFKSRIRSRLHGPEEGGWQGKVVWSSVLVIPARSVRDDRMERSPDADIEDMGMI